MLLVLPFFKVDVELITFMCVLCVSSSRAEFGCALTVNFVIGFSLRISDCVVIGILCFKLDVELGIWYCVSVFG